MRFMQDKIRMYLAWKATYATRASVNYKIWLYRFLQVCGDKPIEKYDITDVVKFRHWLQENFSSCSVQYAIVIIKNFFFFYKEQGVQCMASRLIKNPRIRMKSHRAVTENEFNRIISVIPSNEFRNLRDLVMIRLLWDTGVRVSELLDLDLIHINENKKSTIIFTKKTGKQRAIVWSDETHYFLLKYMTVRLHLLNAKGASALFLGWEKGRGWSLRLNVRAVQRMVKRYVNRAGIKERITPHSFRHGWAHKRRDNHAPLAFIQKGLGHVSPISTFIYEQYDDSDFVSNAREYFKAS